MGPRCGLHCLLVMGAWGHGEGDAPAPLGAPAPHRPRPEGFPGEPPTPAGAWE